MFKGYTEKLWGLIYGESPSADSPKTEDDSIKLYQQLLKDYPNYTKSQLITLVQRVKGDRAMAKAVINYWEQNVPSEAYIEAIQKLPNYDKEKFDNWYKSEKDVDEAIASFRTGKPSKYKQFNDILEGDIDVEDTIINKWNTPISARKSNNTNDSLPYVVQQPSRDIGIFNTGNTCFINTVIQLLYHLPEFRQGILEFNLENEEFKSEYRNLQYQPVKSLKGIFEQLRRQENLGQLPIKIDIFLNPYFECLWIGPYFVHEKQSDGSIRERFETREEYKKRLEIDYGMYKPEHYRTGESEDDRQRRLVKESEGTEAQKADMRKQFRDLRKKIDSEVTEGMNNPDADYQPEPYPGRKQHDITDFLNKCILDKLDKRTTKSLCTSFVFKTQDIATYYFKNKPGIELNLTEAEQEELNKQGRSLTGTVTGLYYKITNMRPQQDENAIMLQLPSLNRGKSGEIQNFIDKEFANFNSSIYEDLNLFKKVGEKIKEEKLSMIIKNFTFPEEMKYLFIQVNRQIADGTKVDNNLHINKIINIKGTYFECMGIACHEGFSGNGGHYIYYWKNDENKFVGFNDSSVGIKKEKNPSSKFIDLQDGFYDIKTMGYCYVYEKKSNITDAQYNTYRSSADIELNTISNIQLFSKLNTTPETEETFGEYLIKYESLKNSKLLEIQRDIQRGIAEGRILPSQGVKYYLTLLETYYPKNSQDPGIKQRRKEALAVVSPNTGRFLISMGRVTNEDELKLLRNRNAARAKAEAEAKAAREAAEAAAVEAERISNVELTERWAEKNLQERQAAAMKVFLQEEEKRQDGDVPRLLLDLQRNRKQIDAIIETYKIDVLKELVLEIHLSLKEIERLRNIPYKVRYEAAQKRLLEYLRQKDIETGSTYIYEILQASDEGRPIFLLSDLTRIDPGTRLRVGMLGDNYSQEILDKNRARFTKRRVVGGKRNKTRKNLTRKK